MASGASTFEPLKTFPNGYPVPFMVQQKEVEDYLESKLGESDNVERLVLWSLERPTIVRCTRENGRFRFDEFDADSGQPLGRLGRKIECLRDNETRLAVAYGMTDPSNFPTMEVFELFAKQMLDRRDE
jgi:hypothetical protein